MKLGTCCHVKVVWRVTWWLVPWLDLVPTRGSGISTQFNPYNCLRPRNREKEREKECVHTYVHTCIYTCMYVCVCVCVHKYTCTCTPVLEGESHTKSVKVCLHVLGWVAMGLWCVDCFAS